MPFRLVVWTLVLVLIPAVRVPAQDISGTWQGMMQEGPSQQARTVVKIQKVTSSASSTNLTGSLYRIDDGVGPIPVGAIALEGRTVKFAVDVMGVTFEGKLSTDGLSIQGIWAHGPTTHPLLLVRSTSQTEWDLPAPRTGPREMSADADPGLEVATIKPSAPSGPGENFGFEGRRFSTTRTTINDLIAFAYGLHSRQIIGAPTWFATDPYDISGVPDVAGEPNLKQYRAMIQKLLADRFKLTFHHEQRELAVYAITVGRGGPKMAKSTVGPDDAYGFSFRGKRGLLAVSNLTMAEFAVQMQGVVMDKPVVDRTGLNGRYDFNLDWTPDDSQFLQARASSAAIAAAADDGSPLPGLLTAMQEQLGLKMEATKAKDDVMVVDRAERPSAN